MSHNLGVGHPPAPPGDSMRPISLAVLVSVSGTTLQNLLDRIAAGQLDAQVKLVIGSRPGLKGLERAAAAKVMNFVVNRGAFDECPDFSREVFSLCDDAGVELICLGGWLCLLDIPSRWTGKIMNIHPALLPCFGGKGMFGPRVHQAVLDHGCKLSGCTVHFVDNTYDTGPIILQRTVPVLEEDTPEDLAARVFQAECHALPEAIALYAAGRLKVEGRRVRILDAP